MGDPKRQRKKYETPRFPWSKAQLDAELKLLGEYGLRNKHELRRHYALLSKYRTFISKLRAMPIDRRRKFEEEFLRHLRSYGIAPEKATIDDIDPTIESILNRRLQTVVLQKGLAMTPQQARQLIVHGHIAVKGRKVRSPSYLVRRDEEQEVGYASSSPFMESGRQKAINS